MQGGGTRLHDTTASARDEATERKVSRSLQLPGQQHTVSSMLDPEEKDVSNEVVGIPTR